MKKKILTALVFVISILSFVNFSTNVSAASIDTSFSGGFTFLTLKNPFDNWKPQQGADVSTLFGGPIGIALTDMLTVVGIVAIVFIIIGGFQYMTSAGDPGRAKNGQTTLIRAVVGLIIALSAEAVVTYIGNAAGLSNAGTSTDLSPGASAALGSLSSLLTIVYFIAGALAIIMIIYAGIQWITSAGDPGKATRARSTLLYSIIGLLIIVGAYAITNFVAGNPMLKFDNVNDIISSVTSVLFYIVGILAVVMIIYSGIRYVSSAGNAQTVTKAKSTLTYSIIGLVVAIMAYALVNYVLGQIGG